LAQVTAQQEGRGDVGRNPKAPVDCNYMLVEVLSVGFSGAPVMLEKCFRVAEYQKPGEGLRLLEVSNLQARRSEVLGKGLGIKEGTK